MKKVMMIAALAAALVSCQSKGTQNNDAVAMDESVMAVTGNTKESFPPPTVRASSMY
jgi:hypothetical protein